MEQAIMGRIEQLTTQSPHNSWRGVDSQVENKKSAFGIKDAFEAVTSKAILEFEIDASGSTAEEVNGLIEKICAAHEQKRFLTIKVKM